MFKNERYGISDLGYLEDIDKITAKGLYEHYVEIMKTSPIDIVVEGNFDEEEIVNIISNGFNFHRENIIDIPRADFNKKVEEVLNDVSVTTVADTQMIQIAYRSTSPNIAKNMLENITNEFIVTAQELVPNGNVRILESVELPKNPVAPNKKMNIAIAFILGMMVGFGIVFLLEYLDNTYKNKEQLEKDLDIPVLGVIPMSDLD